MSDYNSSDQDASLLGKKLLIVDDDDSIVSLFQAVLQLMFSDVEIDIARNGLQAVESFRSKQHGVVLMDLNMPVMGGFTAYNE
ncbi:MAG: response regulator, partial [Kiritimatiellae bacterium]|nr:response regulator [Kiritimatiellia bacterium]